MKAKTLILIFFVSTCFWNEIQAMIINPYIISDNMVLQADSENYIWGYAEPGDNVKISFKSVELETESDKQTGFWIAKLPPLPADSIPSQMKISDSNSNQVIENVRIGDVWIFCINNYLSGNIYITEMAEIEKARKEEREKINEQGLIKNIKIPDDLEQEYQIKNCFFFNVARKVSDKIEFTSTSVWEPVTVEKIHNNMPEAFYKFAKLYCENNNRVLGIINMSYPNSTIEAWISEHTLKKTKEFSELLSRWATLQKNYPLAEKKWKENIEKWKELNQKYQTEFEKYKKNKAFARIKDLKKPQYPERPEGWAESPKKPSGLYNGMLSTIAPFSARAMFIMPSENDDANETIYYELLSSFLDDLSALWKNTPPQIILFQTPSSWKKHNLSATVKQNLPTIREIQRKVAEERSLPVVPSAFPGYDQRQKFAERILFCTKLICENRKIAENLKIPYVENISVEDEGKVKLIIANTEGKLHSLSSLRIVGDQSEFLGKTVDIEYKKTKYGNSYPMLKLNPESSQKVTKCIVKEITELNEEYEMETKTVSFVEISNEKNCDGFYFVDRKNKNIKKAECKIEGDSLILQSDSVKDPSTVIYGYSDAMEISLVNDIGMPFFPFKRGIVNTDKETDKE